MTNLLQILSTFLPYTIKQTKAGNVQIIWDLEADEDPRRIRDQISRELKSAGWSYTVTLAIQHSRAIITIFK